MSVVVGVSCGMFEGGNKKGGMGCCVCVESGFFCFVLFFFVL